jgi:hypothetical protein
MVEKALGHRLLNSRRNAAGIFDAGISNIQMSSGKRVKKSGDKEVEA